MISENSSVTIVDLSQRTGCVNYLANNSFQERIFLPHYFQGEKGSVLLTIASGFVGSQRRPYDDSNGTVLLSEERIEKLGTISQTGEVSVFQISFPRGWNIPRHPVVYINIKKNYYRMEMVPFPGKSEIWAERGSFDDHWVFAVLEKFSESKYDLTVISRFDARALSERIKARSEKATNE